MPKGEKLFDGQEPDDAETAEILKEMQESGDLEPAANDDDKSKKPAEKIEAEPSDDDQDDEDEGKGKPKPKAKDDEGDDDEDEGDEGKPKDKGQRVNRTPKMIPIAKMHSEVEKAEKRVASEKDALISDLTNKLKEYEGKGASDKNAQDLSDDLKEIAEQYDIPADALEKIVGAAAKRSAIPQELKDKLKEFDDWKQETAKQREAEESRQQETFFESEFEALIKEAPYANTKELKKALHDKAFSEDYAKVPLATIFYGDAEFRKLHPAPGRKSAEGAKPGRATKTGKTWDRELTSDEIDDLTDEEFDEYSEFMEKKQGGNIMRNGRPIN